MGERVGSGRLIQSVQLDSEREAVNLALRRLAAEPLSIEEARALRGVGWEGDIEEMRESRAS